MMKRVTKQQPLNFNKELEASIHFTLSTLLSPFRNICHVMLIEN